MVGDWTVWSWQVGLHAVCRGSLGLSANLAVRDLVRSKDTALWEHLGGSWMARWRFRDRSVVGSRQPLSWTLIHGLVESLASRAGSSPDGRRRTVQQLYDVTRQGALLPRR